MTYLKIRCESSDCDGTITVEADQETANCPTCGNLHSRPWVPAEQADAPAVPDSGGMLTCKGCATEFDPNRIPPAVGADTSRCPSCGHKHDIPETVQPESRRPPQSTQTAQTVPDGGEEPTDIVEVDGQSDGVQGGVDIQISVDPR